MLEAGHREESCWHMARWADRCWGRGDRDHTPAPRAPDPVHGQRHQPPRPTSASRCCLPVPPFLAQSWIPATDSLAGEVPSPGLSVLQRESSPKPGAAQFWAWMPIKLPTPTWSRINYLMPQTSMSSSTKYKNNTLTSSRVAANNK